MRLIDADELLKYAHETRLNPEIRDIRSLPRAYVAVSRINRMPTIEGGRKHAGWITLKDIGDTWAECSACGQQQSISLHLEFCPHCGAVMDEVLRRL